MASERVVNLDRSKEELERLLARSAGGGGGPMEPRIAALEARTDGIEKRLDDIKGDLRRIESKMLGEWQVAKVMIYVLGALMAAIAFAPRLVALIQG